MKNLCDCRGTLLYCKNRSTYKDLGNVSLSDFCFIGHKYPPTSKRLLVYTVLLLQANPNKSYYMQHTEQMKRMSHINKIGLKLIKIYRLNDFKLELFDHT